MPLKELLTPAPDREAGTASERDEPVSILGLLSIVGLIILVTASRIDSQPSRDPQNWSSYTAFGAWSFVAMCIV